MKREKADPGIKSVVLHIDVKEFGKKEQMTIFEEIKKIVYDCVVKEKAYGSIYQPQAPGQPENELYYLFEKYMYRAKSVKGKLHISPRRRIKEEEKDA